MANISAKIQKRENLSKIVKEIVKFTPNSKVREGEEFGILNLKESGSPNKKASVNLITLGKGQVIISTSLKVTDVEGIGSYVLDVEYLSKALSSMYDSELELTVEDSKLDLRGKRNNLKIPVYSKDDSSLKAPIKRYASLEEDLKDEVKVSHIIMVNKSDFLEKLEAAQIFSFGGVGKEKYTVLSVSEKEVSILGKGIAILGKGVVGIEKTIKKAEVEPGIVITDEVSKILMSILPKTDESELCIFIGDKKMIFQVGANTIVVPKKKYENDIKKLENFFNNNTDSNYMLTSTDVKNLCSMVSFLEESAKLDFNKETYKIKVTVDPKNKKMISKGENWVECRQIGKDSNKISMELSLKMIEDAMGVFPKTSKDCALSMSVVATEKGRHVHFKSMVRPEKEEDQKVIGKWIQDDLIVILAAKDVAESDVIGVKENNEVTE